MCNRSQSSISTPDDLIATRTDADERDRCFDQRLDAIEIDPRGARELLERAGILGRTLPAVEPLVARHRMLQRVEVARKLREDVAVRFVAGADRHTLERVEHVELRHREIRQSVHPTCVADDDRIEPSAASCTPGRRTELVAELPDPRREWLLELRR